MIVRAFGVAMFAMAASASGWAQPQKTESDKVEYSKAYDTCMEKSDGITVLMRDCMSEEQERQDKDLNTTYRDLIAKSNGSARTTLVRAQRAWVTFRDAECEYDMERLEGGTLASVVGDGCFLSMTARRVEELRSYLKAAR